jgi:transcriptional regulator GlxA family with amidase domain
LAPSLVSTIVDHCLRQRTLGITAVDVANSLGVTRRTLSKRLQYLGIPGVSAVLARTRVLLAVGLLLRGQKPEHVAFQLDFTSGSALRNMLRRHTGLRLSEIPSRGDFAHWCERLLGRDSLNSNW